MKYSRRSILLIVFLWNLIVWAQKPELIIPVGHTAHISSFAFSPDEKYFLTGGSDGVAKLWNREGKELKTYMGHTDFIHHISFSPDGQFILTSSGDGTSRLWDLSGKMLHTFADQHSFKALFFPSGQQILTRSNNQLVIREFSGREIKALGKKEKMDIVSASISPDGKYIVTGYSYLTSAKKKKSYTNSFKREGKIILWDREGNEIRSWGKDLAPIFAISFSPDGRYIMTKECDDCTSGGEARVMIWTLKGKEIIRHENIAYSIGAQFSPDGKHYSVSFSSKNLELRNFKGQLVQNFTPKSGIISSHFSPKGEQIFFIKVRHPEELYTISNQFLKEYDFFGQAAPISKALFYPSGKKLLLDDISWSFSDKEWEKAPYDARYNCFSPDGQMILDKYGSLEDLSGKKIRKFWQGPPYTKDIAISADGNYILTANNDKAVRLWEWSSGKQLKLIEQKQEVLSVAISPKGDYLLTSDKEYACVWSANGQQLHEFRVNYSPKMAFTPEGTRFAISSGFYGNLKLMSINGDKKWEISAHDGLISSLHFSKDGSKILTCGDDGLIKLWNILGKETRRFVGHIGKIKSASFSPDERYIISSGADGSIRIWNTQTGRLIISIFKFKNDGWVVTTPDGRFDGNEIGLSNLYYVQGLEVIAFSQLKERYFEPGLLSKVMGSSNEPLRNVTQFDQIKLFPEVTLRLDKQTISIQLTERGGGIGKVALFVAGKEVKADINPTHAREIRVDLNNYSQFFTPGETVSIGIKAYNKDDWLGSGLVTSTYTAPKISTNLQETNSSINLTAPVRLFVLCIGTSNYQGNQFDLSFADQDAEKVAKTFQLAGQHFLYNDPSRVAVHLLNTSQPKDQWPSKKNIRHKMKEIAKQARPNDLFILYLSGHGTTNDRDDKDYFYYLTHELNSGNINDKEIRQQYAISTAEFADWLTAIPAQKQVFMLDACASGTFNQSLNDLLTSREVPSSQIRALDRLRSRTGLFIISGSTADQVSYEASPFGQGLLTYSLLQGIKSGEALRERQYVDVLNLFNYAKEKVPELADQIGGIQEPMIFMPYGAESYDIGMVTPDVRNTIELSNPKPIFSRVRLSNKDTFDDDLGLEPIFNDQIREFSKMGVKAPFIFVDVQDAPNAYRIVGRYTVSGEDVKIQARIMREQKKIGEEFEIIGQKNALKELGRKIISGAYEEVK